jgi:hypothetical protein
MNLRWRRRPWCAAVLVVDLGEITHFIVTSFVVHLLTMVR